MTHAFITSGRITYAQYKDWPEKERYELINGIAIPFLSPDRLHHDVSKKLFMQIANYSNGKKFHVYLNPFDARLFEDGTKEDEIENVVQPDISIFLDESKLDEKGAISAPDWVIEITSPSTAENDWNKKLLLYQRFKVKEYWIVNPDKKTVLIHKLNNMNTYFASHEFNEQQIIAPELFPELKIDLKEIFAD